jgi:hypothetical protein
LLVALGAALAPPLHAHAALVTYVSSTPGVDQFNGDPGVLTGRFTYDTSANALTSDSFEWTAGSIVLATFGGGALSGGVLTTAEAQTVGSGYLSPITGADYLQFASLDLSPTSTPAVLTAEIYGSPSCFDNQCYLSGPSDNAVTFFATPVPEPSTIVLMASAITILSLRGRRRTARAMIA